MPGGREDWIGRDCSIRLSLWSENQEYQQLEKMNYLLVYFTKLSLSVSVCVCVFFRRLYSYSHVEIPAPAIVMTFLTFPSDINLATPSRLTVDRICLGGGRSPSALAMYSRRNSSPTRAYKGWGSIPLHISASVLVLKLQRIYHDLDHFQIRN